MRDIRHTQQGFTLIEVLVALILMALVSLISWRGLEAVENTGKRLDERSEEVLSMMRALGQMERDILLHAGPDILPTAMATGPQADAEAIINAHGMPPGIAWDAETGLHLVRAAGDGRWQQLRWFLDGGQLLREVGAPSYLLPLPPLDTRVVVLDDVDKLSVKLWQPGQGWVDPNLITQENTPRNRNNAAGNSGTTGIELAVYRQGQAGDQPYRKVVLLP